ncbi:MAG: DUF3536 domain-containing protein [Bacteriovoracaceae bacterium]
MNRYLCIHSHLYQPPRENPWLGEIEIQESAYPFHDWNQRINAECYRENAQSALLTGDGVIHGLINNYSKMSFNFGATLLSWMERHDPRTYELILEGDKLGMKNFGGHGTAIAQCYNHVIMPLANTKDKDTQVYWGLRDFEERFKRVPESMWLPETAVDTETLEILSDYGMKYVILAPRQAKAVRPLNGGSEEWTDVSHEKVDPRQGYLINLPSGRTITAFFYDGLVAKDVAFQGLLHNGEEFANRLVNAFSEDSHIENQLSHIATDGETYGHHHKHGDMALAFALKHIEQNNLAKITNYGQYLELHPPVYEAQIHENSSWSCVHGVERWRENCGCNSGGHPHWHQKWRKPFRDSLDIIRDEFQSSFVKKMKEMQISPWKIRNDYFELIYNRTEEHINSFTKKWAPQLKDRTEISNLIKELEVQHQAQLMYTSCAWFFDEVSGLETTQNMRYACRALELYKDLYPENDLEEKFSDALGDAPSNIAEFENGKTIYEKLIKPSKVNFFNMAVHVAISNLFEEYPKDSKIYAFNVHMNDVHRFELGKNKIVCGRARLTSRITGSVRFITFGAIHFGDHNLNAGVRFFQSEDHYKELVEAFEDVYKNLDLPGAIRILDREFGPELFTLKDLLQDYRYKVIDELMKDLMGNIEGQLGNIYKENYSLMSHLSGLNVPLPKVLHHIGSFIKHNILSDNLSGNLTPARREEIESIIEDTKKWGITLQHNLIAIPFEQAIIKRTQAFIEDAENLNLLEEISFLLNVSNELEFDLEINEARTNFFKWLKAQTLSPIDSRKETINQVCQQLKIRLD